MKHDLRSFKGCVPRADAEALPIEVPKQAYNGKVDNGGYTPYRQSKSMGVTLAKGGVNRSLFLFNHSSGPKWLHWPELVDVALSPLLGSDKNKVYFTNGLNGLQETGPDLVTDGKMPEEDKRYPVNSRKVYVPQPTVNIEVAGGDNEGIRRLYTYTFSSGRIENDVVTDFGYESAPAPASPEVFYDDQLDEGQTHNSVTLTLPTVAPDGAVVSHINIYRLAETGDFQLIKTVPFGTASYVDDYSKTPGRILDTFDLIPPPDKITNLTLLESGSLAASFEKEVLVTPPYVVYAWPDKYRFKCESNVVGLVATRAGLLVATETVPYSLNGYEPSNMVPVRLDLNEPCASSRSLVDMGEYALYAGTNGLVVVSVGSAKLITSTLLSERQWQALNPSNMFACEYDGKYLAFCAPDASGEFSDFSGFIFDPSSGELFFHKFEATACFRDPRTGNVYYCDKQNNIQQFDAGSGFVQAGFLSGKIENPYRRFTHFRVEADSAVDIEFVADGKVLRAGSFEPGEIYRLPLNRARLWQYRITSAVPFRRLVVATNHQELI